MSSFNFDKWLQERMSQMTSSAKYRIGFKTGAENLHFLMEQENTELKEKLDKAVEALIHVSKNNMEGPAYTNYISKTTLKALGYFDKEEK